VAGLWVNGAYAGDELAARSTVKYHWRLRPAMLLSADRWRRRKSKKEMKKYLARLAALQGL
jgi:hypothetical protein